MAWALGFAGGFADLELVEAPPPAGGGGVFFPYRPRRRREPVAGEGLAVVRLKVTVSAGVGVGAARTAKRFELRTRAYDPTLEERNDRILIALTLIALKVPGRFFIPLPIGQQEEDWYRRQVEQWEVER